MEETGSSSALQANLAQTRVEVVIPEKFDVLFEAVADYAGAKSDLDNLLREYHHPMRNMEMLAVALRDASGPRTFHLTLPVARSRISWL